MLTRRLVDEGIAPTVTLSVKVDQQTVQLPLFKGVAIDDSVGAFVTKYALTRINRYLPETLLSIRLWLVPGTVSVSAVQIRYTLPSSALTLATLIVTHRRYGLSAQAATALRREVGRSLQVRFAATGDLGYC
jgi:hypothetical protein